MDSDRVLTITLAALLIVGVGMTASSLDAVETTPDDAINIDASTVPLGVGELEEYKERITGTRMDEPDDRDETSPSTSPDSDEPEREATTNAERDQQQRESESESEQLTSGINDHPFVHWLLALLRALLDLLMVLLPLLAVLAIIVLAIAKRDWIFSVLGINTPDAPADNPSKPSQATRIAPANDIEHAWYEMATMVGTEHLETTTPGECATKAVAAGADPTPVDRLTRIFEEVRYGEADITPERRSMALDELDRIRTQLGGSS